MILLFGKPPGVPCPPNNPHCNGNAPDVPLDDPYFIIAMILIAIMFALIKLKIINMEKIYGTISRFLFGDKSCMPSELRGF